LRSTAHLVCTLHFHQPIGVGPQALDRAFDDYYDVLLDVVEEDPNLRVNLHFTGTILEHAVAHHPAFLDRLRALWKDDRIELLGGAFHDPALPSIPERDALGQLQYTSNFYEQNFGRRPEGAWLCLRSWDSALIRMMGGAGVRYTLLDDAQFVVAGMHPDSLKGHYTTERAGHTMNVFPIDHDLVRAVQDGGKADMLSTLESLSERARDIEGVEVFAGDGQALMETGRLGDFLSLLRSEYLWVKTYPLGTALRLFRSRGRVYLPTSADPQLGDWCRPADTVKRRRNFMAQMEAMGVKEEAQQFAGGVVFDNFLVKYPEVNRLHKRMLRASRRVDQLRTVLRTRQQSGRAGAGDQKARAVLQKACSALWRSQNHSAYWHGGDHNEGIYNPIIRQRAQRELLQAEAAIDKILTDRKGNVWRASRADFDADGDEDVQVITPQFISILNAADGGTVQELDLRPHSLPLLSSFSPVEEPYHEALAGNEVMLVDDDEADTLPTLPRVAPQASPALKRLVLETSPRGFCQDHFLAPETTLEAFSRRQFRELGDFAVGAFEVDKVESPEGDGQPGTVILGRSGVVRDLDRTSLLRVEKSYRFGVERPRLQMTHTITNRSRDSVSLWHGLEWTFGVPSARPEKVKVRAVCGDKEVTACLTDAPVDLGEATWLEWIDEGAGLAVVIELEEARTFWWTPVITVHRKRGGWKEVVQGSTLMAHGLVDIWGQESRALGLHIDFLPL
jgi:4-alpha-glucanotransferase